jgi:hypothetical protein
VFAEGPLAIPLFTFNVIEVVFEAGRNVVVLYFDIKPT